MSDLDSSPGGRMLALAGSLSAAVASLHFGIILAGAPAYRYFGAGERMARADEHGSLIPGLITLGLTLLFTTWCLYAFSGARLFRPLPWVRSGLVIIGSIYTLRGLAFFPQIALFLSASQEGFQARQLAFSLVSLLIGLVHLIGTRRAWRSL